MVIIGALTCWRPAAHIVILGKFLQPTAIIISTNTIEDIKQRLQQINRLPRKLGNSCRFQFLRCSVDLDPVQALNMLNLWNPEFYNQNLNDQFLLPSTFLCVIAWAITCYWSVITIYIKPLQPLSKRRIEIIYCKGQVFIRVCVGGAGTSWSNTKIFLIDPLASLLSYTCV